MERIKVNLSLSTIETLPNRRMEDDYVVTGLTVNGKSYIEIGEYCVNYARCSDSTVRRLLKKVEHRRCNDFFIRLNNKIYVSPGISVLANEKFGSADSINGNWEVFIRSYSWHYFGCVRYRWNLSQATIKSRMSTFFERLSNKYKSAEIRLFYTCEQNPSNDGYHVHFVLWSDAKGKTELRSFMENHFRGCADDPIANTKIEKYDSKKGGAGYILKQMGRNPDGYDFLYKNKP